MFDARRGGEIRAHESAPCLEALARAKMNHVIVYAVPTNHKAIALRIFHGAVESEAATASRGLEMRHRGGHRCFERRIAAGDDLNLCDFINQYCTRQRLRRPSKTSCTKKA